MSQYTDDDIRNKNKITRLIAGDYLWNPSNTDSIVMRNNLLPIGFTVNNEENDRRFSESLSYYIVAERLTTYKYGKISEVRVQNIEKNLGAIIKEFELMKNELIFILSENTEWENFSMCFW